MRRVRVVSTGWVGAPGLLTFYFADGGTPSADAALLTARVRAFLDGIKTSFGSAIRYDVQAQVDTIEPTDGLVTGTTIVSPAPAQVVCTGTGNLASPQVAVLVRWLTDTFLDGRRLTGRTFFTQVTLVSSIGADGRISAGGVNTFMTGCGVIASVADGGPPMVVWRRPRKARTLPTPLSARVGASAPVQDHTVSTKPATLNSRRD
jgi:hypothetical protein